MGEVGEALVGGEDIDPNGLSVQGVETRTFVLLVLDEVELEGDPVVDGDGGRTTVDDQCDARRAARRNGFAGESDEAIEVGTQRALGEQAKGEVVEDRPQRLLRGVGASCRHRRVSLRDGLAEVVGEARQVEDAADDGGRVLEPHGSPRETERALGPHQVPERDRVDERHAGEIDNDIARVRRHLAGSRPDRWR